MKKEKLINKNNTIISKNVSEALNVKKTISSGNIMFVGEQDLTSLILSNILQLNSSFVVTASNNEIVSPDIERFLKSNGYKVKILDLRPIHESSECYNPLKRIKNEDDMCKFVDCIMMDWKSKDDFRRKLVHYLLMAVVAYVLEYNKEDKKNIIELSNFFISNGYAYCEKDDNVYHAFEVIENCSHDSLAYKYYTAYDKSSGKSKKEILSSVLQILQRYGILSYKTFSKDTLTIESMEEEKIALFVIPDSQNSFDAIYSILYMQIIDALFEFEDKNRGSELIPVQLFMNNFAKYTTIPEFGHNLAVMCNYKVSVRLFVKNITQLKEKYSDIWKDMICNL